MRTVKLLRSTVIGEKTWDAGSVLDVDEITYQALTANGSAMDCDPEAEAAAAKAAADAIKQETERITATVRSTLQETLKEFPHVAKVHPRIEDDPKRGYKGLGDFVQDVIQAGNGGKPSDKLLGLNEKAASNMGEVVGALGGFLVPDEFRAQLLEKTYNASAVAGRCTQIPMASNSVHIPRIVETTRVAGGRQGGVSVFWMDEGTAKTPAHPTFGQVELKLHKVAGYCPMTDELIADSAISIEPLITGLFARELATVLDDAIINGTGAGQPLGILTSPCLVTVAQEAGQLINTLLWENVVNMWSRCWGPSRPNAVWLINQDIEPQLFSMSLVVGLGGVPVYLPAGGASGSPYGTLFGRPVIPCESCASLTNVGDIILGDFSQYLLGQASGGVQTASSIHVRFLNDETVLRFVMRVDGQPWWASAVTPMSGVAANTLSPFVVLHARP